MKFKIIFFLLAGVAGFTQTGGSKSEWDQLDKTFVAVVKALQENDKATFAALSLPEVDCLSCRVTGDININEESYFIPAELFYENLAKNFTNSQLYKSLVSRGYSFRTVVMRDYKPSVLPPSYPQDLTLYEVWVDTYLAGEWAPQHQGLSHVFQFVKIGNNYKLFGLTTKP